MKNKESSPFFAWLILSNSIILILGYYFDTDLRIKSWSDFCIQNMNISLPVSLIIAIFQHIIWVFSNPTKKIYNEDIHSIRKNGYRKPKARNC
jgi:hypothetical protein